MTEAELYFLNPDHKPFVEGESSTLGSTERAHFAHTYYMGIPTIIALIVLAVFMVYLGFQLWQEQQITRQLEQEGVEAPATVVSLRDDESGWQPYHIVYSFTPAGPDGQTTTLTGTQSINEQEYRLLDEGDTLAVLYLPDDPTISRYTEPESTPVWVCLPYVLLPVLGIYLAKWYYSLGHWWGLRRLEKEGRLLDGQVIRARTGIDLPKDRVQVWVDYRFVSPQSGERTDKGEGGMEKTDPLPKPGTPVKVLYVDDQLYRLM